MKRILAFFLAFVLVVASGAVGVSVGAKTAALGDVNADGKVDSTDARLVLQYAVKKIVSLDVPEAADVDGSGTADSTDARLILQYAVKKIDKFPADEQEDTSGIISPNSEAAGRPFATPDELEGDGPPVVEGTTAHFGYFALTTELNAGLPFNVALYDGGDTLTAVLPAGVDTTALIPTFTYYGKSVTAGGATVQSDITVLDLSTPLVLTLTSQNGTSHEVTVKVQTLDTGLPSMAVTLNGYVGADAIQKEEYTAGNFYLGGGDSAVCDYAQETPVLVACTIKGRGNSSWLLDEKKSYTLKLDKKTALLDMAASKNWALVANYEDKTLLRNAMGYYFATAAGVPVVMQVRPVDMWIDGEYWGTYNLTEKIEIEPDRVNITDVEKPTDKNFVDLPADQVGYLLEFDAHVVETNAGGLLENVGVFNPYDGATWEELAKVGWKRYECDYFHYAANTEAMDYVFYNPETDETFFKLPFLGKWVTVKKPSTENLNHNPAMREYIFQKVRELDSALEANNHNVIYDMLDLDSFAAWALVQEMMDNTDSTFHSSVYMYMDVDGQFTFGPAWDFDRSSGNCSYWDNKNVGNVLNSRWCWAAFNTDRGREALKNAWQIFKMNTADWYDVFEDYQQLIEKSRIYNFERWDILKKHILYNQESLTDETMLSFYEGEEYQLFIDHLSGWLTGRMNKMNQEYKNRFPR